MLSLIIIYLIGVFFAYIILGYLNDLNNKNISLKPQYNVYDTLWSWLVVVSVLLHKVSLHYPSFNKFINVFKQKNYEQ